jgi:hypothetical protein
MRGSHASALLLAATLAMPGRALAESGFIYPTFERFTWRESAESGARLLEERGSRFGLGVEAQTVILVLPVRYRGAFSWGRVDYDGHTQAMAPVRSKTTYVLFDFQLDIAPRFGGGDAVYGPFAGLGYRYWTRDIASATTTDASGRPATAEGYMEKWTLVYAKVGLYGDLRLSSPWGLSAEAGALIPLDSENQALGLTFKPDGQVSLFAQAGVRYGWFAVALAYEAMRFDASARVPVSGLGFTGYAMQPRSASDLYTVKVGVSY